LLHWDEELGEPTDKRPSSSEEHGDGPFCRRAASASRCDDMGLEGRGERGNVGPGRWKYTAVGCATSIRAIEGISGDGQPAGKWRAGALISRGPSI